MPGFVSRENQSKSARNLKRDTLAVALGCSTFFWAAAASAQVFTVETDKIESRYTDIRRTHVELGSQPLLQRTRQELIRVMDAEQGFAMRPLPKGSKGIVLVANGSANPNGAEYVKALQHNGIAFQAADRVAVTDMKIFPDKIVFEFNGGPDQKHRFLRHISVGAGGMMIPLAQDNGQPPAGVRLTLQFEKFIPEMTGTQLMELLSPLVDFKLKTPIQAYTDTLPPKLKEAILNHKVLVGMSPEMVLYALGHPDSKSRERDGDMPFEEWIYGEPPKDVQFVRFNGNRVIQVEEAKMGQPPIIRKEDEMGDYWTVAAANPDVHEVNIGGDTRNSARDAQTANSAPPSLKKPGETLPNDDRIPRMDKVQFPPGMDGSKPPQPANAPAAQPASAPSTGNGEPPPSQWSSRYSGFFM